jgi:hypothetical protein
MGEVHIEREKERTSERVGEEQEEEGENGENKETYKHGREGGMVVYRHH